MTKITPVVKPQKDLWVLDNREFQKLDEQALLILVNDKVKELGAVRNGRVNCKTLARAIREVVGNVKAPEIQDRLRKKGLLGKPEGKAAGVSYPFPIGGDNESEEVELVLEPDEADLYIERAFKLLENPGTVATKIRTIISRLEDIESIRLGRLFASGVTPQKMMRELEMIDDKVAKLLLLIIRLN